MSLALTGTVPLLRTNIRFDGRLYAPWIVLATALSASSVLVYPWVFPTEADRVGLAAAVGSNPALGLIFGPARDLATVDGFNAWRSLALGGFLAALGAIFAVTRATRAQEDSGQSELLASGVVGRESRLLAATAMALTGSLVLGLVAAVTTILIGGSPGPSLLIGATFTATGWLFTAVAAVTAQLGSDARTANSLAVGTLGALFVLRGFAYSVEAPDWTIWINPLGWMTETQPATGDHWWPLLLPVALAAILLALGFALQARRDFGQGAIAPRPGPSHSRVRGTWRLAVRINRGPMIAWAAAFVGLGLVFGRFVTSINEILAGNSAVRDILAAGAVTPDMLLGAFLLTVLSLIGIIAAVPGVQTMLKVRVEEMDDRVEPVLAASVARSRYLASNVVLALLQSAAFLLVAGTIIAVLVSRTDLGLPFGEVVVQVLAVVPAVWTVTAISVTVVGARPQVRLAAWVGVVLSFGLTLLGPTFGLPDWALGISPFWHVPATTNGSSEVAGLLWISAVTVILLSLGFAGFRHRDLAR